MLRQSKIEVRARYKTSSSQNFTVLDGTQTGKVGATFPTRDEGIVLAMRKDLCEGCLRWSLEGCLVDRGQVSTKELRLQLGMP